MSDKEKFLYIGGIILLIVIVVAITFLISVKMKLNFKRDYILRNETHREKCLAKAENEYITTWNNSCSYYKTPKAVAGKTQCALEAGIAMYYKQAYKDAKDECIKMYPIELK